MECVYIYICVCVSDLLQANPDDASGKEFKAVQFQQPPAEGLSLMHEMKHLQDEHTRTIHNQQPFFHRHL